MLMLRLLPAWSSPAHPEHQLLVAAAPAIATLLLLRIIVAHLDIWMKRLDGWLKSAATTLTI